MKVKAEKPVRNLKPLGPAVNSGPLTRWEEAGEAPGQEEE